MTISKELALAMAESRRKIEQKRVKVRPFVKGRPRGRPIKHSGTYYTRSVLITDRLMLKIRKNRLPGEPLGCTLERLVMGAEQKKVNAQLTIDPSIPSASILDNDTEFNKVWRELDS